MARQITANCRFVPNHGPVPKNKLSTRPWFNKTVNDMTLGEQFERLLKLQQRQQTLDYSRIGRKVKKRNGR